MARNHVTPTRIERTFAEDEIIVSKTDCAGKITYANRVFLSVAQYTESEVLGAPHNLVRHPDMPRGVFKLLWDTIAAGQEIFAYVLNMAKSGDHYWVFAHVTPTFDSAGKIIGYHSSRRCPKRSAVAKIAPIYQKLLTEEARYPNAKLGMQASTQMLVGMLTKASVSYGQFVFSL